MDITDIVTTEYVSFDRQTTISRARGEFVDSALKAVLIENDDELVGVITADDLTELLAHEHDKLAAITGNQRAAD